jgi:murein L,D-transpeptidase YafK
MFNPLAPSRRRPGAPWILAAALLCAVPAVVSATSGELRAADQVLVVKSEHRLYLIRDGRPYRSYKVALGLNPIGHKEREGDFRTPEGRYLLDARNAASDFFLSIHLSYPSPDDVERARRHHWPAGGSIMIHGLPNVPKRPIDYYKSADWTDGCIALNNDDMLEVWLLTRANTPIEIRP